MINLLRVGDRVELSGGYNPDPTWLGGRSGVRGKVAKFVPGLNSDDAVIRLDESLTVKGVTGQFLVLKLRYVGAEWTPTETVHVELCDFEPGQSSWQDRNKGEWVESHATYKRI